MSVPFRILSRSVIYIVCEEINKDKKDRSIKNIDDLPKRIIDPSS